MKIKTLLLFLILGCSGINAQVVYEPLYRNVYSYLSRIAQRGVIEFDDLVQPIPRKIIVEKLEYLQQVSHKLTPLERKELTFFYKEYTQDTKLMLADSLLPLSSKVQIFKYNKNDRFRFLASQDKLFSINFQPIFGYKFLFNNDSKNITHRWSGFWTYGYIGKRIGYSFDFRANQEDGLGVDSTKSFSQETGVIARFRKNGLEYSDVKAVITYDWKWGNIAVGKDFMPVGYGSDGRIILSTKAPSFPLIRLDVKPVKWFAFNYAHIWLNSDVVDSTKIRASGIPGVSQVSDVPKFMATHSLIFTPFKGFRFLLGESIIYNNQVQLGYLTPILFFRAVSHYQGELTRSNTVSNSQFFAQISSRNHIPHTHLYASFWVDEVSLSIKGRNQTAYNLGVSLTDFPINNLYISTDYTRVRPYAYVHYLPMQTYQNAGYNLGHWIGPNADQWSTTLQYRVSRGLDIRFMYRYVRKGTVGEGVIQRNEVGTPFLWGQTKYLENIEAYLNYEIVHDLFFKLGYQHTSITKKQNQNNLLLTLNYGF